jgi:hypothetical protein
MRPNKLLRFANIFYSLASGEELPANSSDLKTVLANLEKLETYAARKKYAEANLEHLSSGSSRITYLTPDKTVIKLAKNDRGLAQNKEEVAANSKCNSKYLNKVLKNVSNYYWIEVPFLDKITEKKFKEMTGIDFDDFGEALRYSLRSISGNTDKEKPSDYEEITKSDLFKEISDIGKKLDLMPGDLARVSSYGIKDNHPVLADVGLTKNVYEAFYESSSS